MIAENCFPQTLVKVRANGTAVTAAATPTSLLTSAAAAGKYTIPANFFKNVGDKLEIRAYGRISSPITTPGTATFDVRLGGTVVFNGAAIVLNAANAHTNDHWWLEIDLWLETIGATASFFGHGRWISDDIDGAPATPPKGSLVAGLPWNTAPTVGTAFDATAGLQCDLFYTHSLATASCQLHAYELIAKVAA